MKNKIKLYAEALAEFMIEGMDQKKIEKFLAFLDKNGDMGKAKQILALAESLFIKKTGRRKVILETARKIKPKQKEELIGVLSRGAGSRMAGQKGDIAEEKINPDLLAGIKIIINDEQLDLSMQNKLNKLFS